MDQGDPDALPWIVLGRLIVCCVMWLMRKLCMNTMLVNVALSEEKRTRTLTSQTEMAKERNGTLTVERLGTKSLSAKSEISRA